MNAHSAIESGAVIHGYRFMETLGKGGFATVYRVVHEASQGIFAAKVMNWEDGGRGKNWMFYDSELKTLCALDHPHIIRLYSYFKEGSYIFLILEYCPFGTLADLIAKSGAVSGQRLTQITHQLVSAIIYAHNSHIAHRDIKPHNVLFDQFGRVKLADFGIATINDGSELCRQFNCSRGYAAPEILRREPHSPFAADIWALGVTIYYASHGCIPWTLRKGMKGLEDDILHARYVVNPRIDTPILVAMMKAMIVVSPQDRAHAEQLDEFQEQLRMELEEHDVAQRGNRITLSKMRSQVYTSGRMLKSVDYGSAKLGEGTFLSLRLIRQHQLGIPRFGARRMSNFQ